MFLRQSGAECRGYASGDGLLSLHVVPALVCWASECVQSLATIRKWCKACGGHLLTEHPGFGLVDVYAAVIPDLPFEPMLHVNYGETVLHLHDGLPKQKDFPTDMGGSGISLPE
jgi:hypothetical protein